MHTFKFTLGLVVSIALLGAHVTRGEDAAKPINRKNTLAARIAAAGEVGIISYDQKSYDLYIYSAAERKKRDALYANYDATQATFFKLKLALDAAQSQPEIERIGAEYRKVKEEYLNLAQPHDKLHSVVAYGEDYIEVKSVSERSKIIPINRIAVIYLPGGADAEAEVTEK